MLIILIFIGIYICITRIEDICIDSMFEKRYGYKLSEQNHTLKEFCKGCIHFMTVVLLTTVLLIFYIP